jgi:hypothetical protein
MRLLGHSEYVKCWEFGSSRRVLYLRLGDIANIIVYEWLDTILNEYELTMESWDYVQVYPSEPSG